MRGAAALAVLAALAVFASPAAAGLFQWTDDEGVVRYTNDIETIPEKFRQQARDVGSPRVREVPAAEAPAPQPADSTVIPFQAGAPIVAVARLNGVELALMVDTGADRTVISPAAIARAGYGAEAGRAVTIVGVAGSAAAREISVPLMDLGGRQIGPLRIIVHDVASSGLDGLLGRDVLDYFTLTVDTAGGRAILAPR
ncbi:MAG: clan AA aspartic protease [Candidatus Rokubacteria bacterium]|nr:clan AA aspartic protease [Candidatus Rokubacteria bacterium]